MARSKRVVEESNTPTGDVDMVSSGVVPLEAASQSSDINSVAARLFTFTQTREEDRFTQAVNRAKSTLAPFLQAAQESAKVVERLEKEFGQSISELRRVPWAKLQDLAIHYGKGEVYSKITRITGCLNNVSFKTPDTVRKLKQDVENIGDHYKRDGDRGLMGATIRLRDELKWASYGSGIEQHIHMALSVSQDVLAWFDRIDSSVHVQMTSTPDTSVKPVTEYAPF
jgi:hypothetical protein